MNILYITQRVPYPPNRGDKLAAYHAIRYLAAKHAVTVAALAESEEELAQARKLAEMGVHVEAVLHTPGARRAGAIRALLSGTSLSVGHFGSRALAQRIMARAAGKPFDVVLAFSSSMGQYADLIPEVPLVADFVDMDSRKWALYAQARPWPLSRVYALEARRLLAWERHLATRARVSLVRTAPERADCVRLIPDARFEVLRNGVDLEYFTPPDRRPRSHEIVFTGVMDYFPNVDAVEWFCKAVFRQVRSAIPHATFTIVGARPTRAVLAHARRPGVYVTGSVLDVRPYLARAAVAVAPLRLARGIQNKVLEAMAMAMPVVASRAAFRGVDAPEGEGVLAADSADGFARELIGLLRDPERAETLGRRGRRFVELHRAWPDQLRNLERLLDEASLGRRGDGSKLERDWQRDRSACA